MCGSDSMSGIAEVYSFSSAESTGGALSLLGHVQSAFPAYLSGVSECRAAVAQRTFTSGSDSTYLMYFPSKS